MASQNENYEGVLKRVYASLPKSKQEMDRFEIPKVVGHTQGNRTIISNFHQIAGVLRRRPEHLLKYVLNTLATPGELKRAAVIFGSKVSASRINEKIKQYAKEFVFCRECGKPDTQFVKKEGINYLKCLACGAKYPVKG